MLCNVHSVVRAHSEGLRSNLKHLNSIKALRLRLDGLALLNTDHSCRVDRSYPRVEDSDYCPLVDLPFAPFQDVVFASVAAHSFNRPPGLRDEFLDLLSLIDAEPKSWCLTRTIGNHSESGARLFH